MGADSMILKLINHKHTFPPRGQEDNAAAMLTEIAKTEPKFAFVVEWPSNGDMPVIHTTTEDAAVLALRLQNFLSDLYAGKYPNFFIENEK